MRLKGKTALITGATAGIGEACAKLFAAEGASVLMSGRDQARGDAVLAAIKDAGGNVEFVTADLREAGACDMLVEETVKRLGRIDVLVNNAGILYSAPAASTTDEEWADTFAVNVTAVFQLARAALNKMIAQGGGSIVNIASESGLNGEPGLSAYCASKGAVVQMTKCMALDHIGDNVRVNSVCPGETRTKMIDDWLESLDGDIEDNVNDLAKGLPIRRLAKPSEIANAALFLASDEASYCVGTNLSVDGGNAATGGPYPI
jgi:meso-butanediol dehydrogenase/(S,S)-butanediol dehydrogenase/diacetyl reductase